MLEFANHVVNLGPEFTEAFEVLGLGGLVGRGGGVVDECHGDVVLVGECGDPIANRLVLREDLGGDESRREVEAALVVLLPDLGGPLCGIEERIEQMADVDLPWGDGGDDFADGDGVAQALSLCFFGGSLLAFVFDAEVLYPRGDGSAGEDADESEGAGDQCGHVLLPDEAGYGRLVLAGVLRFR